MAISTSSPGATRKLGKKLGELARPGDVIALTGPLGAGKTVLAKGIAEGLDVVDEVTSPSFNIVLEYTGRLTLYHVDFYRLVHGSEAIDVGIEEYLYGEGVTVVEWAERFPGILPERRLDVGIGFGDRKNDRVIDLDPKGREMADRFAHITAGGKD